MNALVRSHAPFAALTLLLSACAGVPPRPANDPADRAALLAADTAFDRGTAERGIDAWISWFEPPATSWVKGELAHDREVYRTTLGPLFGKPGTHLRWQPHWAESAGDLGYTTGKWQLHRAGADPTKPGDDVVVATGRYVTVWRRQTEGGWKAAFDMGNDDKPLP